MSLPFETEKAIAEERAKRPVLGTDHDLRELIEKSKTEKKEEEKKEEVTPEAIDKVTEALAGRLGHRKKKEEKKDEKKEDKPGDAEGDRSEVQVRDDEAKEKPTTEIEDVDDGSGDPGKGTQATQKSKAKISKKPDIDPVEIASAAAARTAQAIMGQHAASGKEVPAKGIEKGIEDSLSDEEKGELEVFREMAKLPQFKELPRKYLAYLKKAEDYQRKWEQDHPDQEFNPEANDHDAFYQAHQPKYSELEYKKAIVRMEGATTSNKELEELRAEQKRVNAELAARELEPAINQTSIGALAEVIKGIDGTILEGIQKDGFDKYAEEHPLEGDLIRAVATNLGPFITGLLQWDDIKGRIPFNKDNPAHMEAVRYLRQKEDELKGKNWKERLTEDGKVIVPRAEYFNMTDAQKASHAYLDTMALIKMRVEEETEKAQAAYEREQKKLEALAKRRGWVKTDGAKNGQENGKKEDKVKEEAPPSRSEIKSPESTSSARVDTTGDTLKAEDKKALDLTADILFARR